MLCGEARTRSILHSEVSAFKASIYALRRARVDCRFIMEDSTKILDISPGTRGGDIPRLRGRDRVYEDNNL